MKKLRLLFLLIAFTYVAQAQEKKPTKEETLSYIQSKITDYGEVDVLDSIKLLREETMDYDGVSPIRINVLSWKDVRTIEYLKIDENWIITVSGKVFRYLYLKDELYKKAINPGPGEFVYKNREFGKEEPGNNMRIFLTTSIVETEVKKIVKALKHMAILNNAQLLKEDLF